MIWHSLYQYHPGHSEKVECWGLKKQGSPLAKELRWFRRENIRSSRTWKQQEVRWRCILQIKTIGFINTLNKGNEGKKITITSKLWSQLLRNEVATIINDTSEHLRQWGRDMEVDRNFQIVQENPTDLWIRKDDTKNINHLSRLYLEPLGALKFTWRP